MGDIGIFEQDGDDSARSIAYNFGPHFLDIQTVGTELTFNIGPYPMQRFRMIERHYFRDMIIKSFDFEMPFAMPNSRCFSPRHRTNRQTPTGHRRKTRGW